MNSSKKQIISASTIKGNKVKGTDTSDRKRELANQMRQKAAIEAAKHQTHIEKEAAEAPSKPPSPPSQIQNQHTMVKKNEKKPLSPMETYEMSDRGESDSDESDYEDRGPKKKVGKQYV